MTAKGRQLPELSIDPREQSLKGITLIFEQMPAVKHLLRGGSAICTTTRILIGTVARNNTHTGMILQPCRNYIGGTIWQEVNRLAALKINNDRSV